MKLKSNKRISTDSIDSQNNDDRDKIWDSAVKKKNPSKYQSNDLWSTE